MRPGNSPQLACWSILAFGFQFYNHRHHSRWEDFVVYIYSFTGHPSRLCVRTFTTSIRSQCLARNPNEYIHIRLGKAKKKGAAQCAMVEGPRLELRSCDYQSQVLAGCTIPPYKVLFICPRKHQARVRKFYLYPTYQKVLALRLIELTWSTYIPYPASGSRSVRFR